MRFLTLLFVTLGMLMATMSFMPRVQAADVLKDVCQQRPSATACQEKNATGNKNPIFGPEGFLTRVIGIISSLVGIGAVIFIIVGGFKFVTSGSNPESVSKARETILYAIIGLIIAGLAQALVQFILVKIR